jgi:hypothetical protein
MRNSRIEISQEGTHNGGPTKERDKAIVLAYYVVIIVTVHGVAGILSATKILVHATQPREILRCAQNDGVFASP